MAKNAIQEGKILSLAVPVGTTSGAPVLVGKIHGVALIDRDATSGKATVQTTGVFDLSVKAVDDVGNSAVAVGDHIYYVDADTPKLSKKVSGNFFGYAVATITAGSTATINVLVIQGPGPGTADILAGAVGTAELADSAVTTVKIAAANVTGPKASAKLRRHMANSRLFNVDNGAGVTVDDVIMVPSTAITITAARVMYTTETAGVVAGANVKLGTTVGGAEIVAATALVNNSTVGATTALVLVSAAVAANTMLVVRHTGIATVAAGEYYVEIEYTVDEA